MNHCCHHSPPAALVDEGSSAQHASLVIEQQQTQDDNDHDGTMFEEQDPRLVVPLSFQEEEERRRTRTIKGLVDCFKSLLWGKQQSPQQHNDDPDNNDYDNNIGRLLFLIGVWNNAPYVVMLACAKDISEGGVALVYIANILPGESTKGVRA